MVAMTVGWQEQLKPGVALREIVQQATAALISMDAERLEELARCCADLNREIESTGAAMVAGLVLREAENEVKLLGCVLYETRANLTVLSRLYALRLRETGVLRKRSPHGQRCLGDGPAEFPNRTERMTEYGHN
jgi:hypothetical protein